MADTTYMFGANEQGNISAQTITVYGSKYGTRNDKITLHNDVFDPYEIDSELSSHIGPGCFVFHGYGSQELSNEIILGDEYFKTNIAKGSPEAYSFIEQRPESIAISSQNNDDGWASQISIGSEIELYSDRMSFIGGDVVIKDGRRNEKIVLTKDTFEPNEIVSDLKTHIGPGCFVFNGLTTTGEYPNRMVFNTRTEDDCYFESNISDSEDNHSKIIQCAQKIEMILDDLTGNPCILSMSNGLSISGDTTISAQNAISFRLSGETTQLKTIDTIRMKIGGNKLTSVSPIVYISYLISSNSGTTIYDPYGFGDPIISTGGMTNTYHVKFNSESLKYHGFSGINYNEAEGVYVYDYAVLFQFNNSITAERQYSIGERYKNNFNVHLYGSSVIGDSYMIILANRDGEEREIFI